MPNYEIGGNKMKEITITKGQFSDKSTTVVAEAIEELSK